MAPSSAAQSLPPSVEEAYRRKCALLKQRMADVEETNDAVRVRLARLKRQVEKQRLERAFLLEQLAKRTSANVEDSDGSPSPPPTPKDKPLRTKRGHRKASLTGTGEPGSATTTFISQNVQAHSPNSDVASNNVDSQNPDTQVSTKSGGKGRDKDKDKGSKDKSSKADGGEKDKDGDSGAAKESLKRPGNGFELYCAEMRPGLADKKQGKKRKKGSGEEGDDVDMEDAAEDAAEEDAGGSSSSSSSSSSNIDADLARGWKDMSQSDRDEFEARASDELAKHKKAKEDARQQRQKDKGDDNEKEAENEVEAEDAKTGEKKEPAKHVVKDEDTDMADGSAAPSSDSKE